MKIETKLAHVFKEVAAQGDKTDSTASQILDIYSFAPSYRHSFFYDYGFRIPERWESRAMLFLAMRMAGLVLPKQGNQFAFGALKNAALQPWLTNDLQFKHSR